MGPNHHPTLVREVKPSGFVAVWRGQTVRSVDGSIRYFISEHDAWMFLWLCDIFGDMPAIRTMEASDREPNEVVEIGSVGFLAFWRGQKVHSVGGSPHYFPSEREAWTFLKMCDRVRGIPAIRQGLPAAC
jgi:hypothetical protein